MMSMITPPVAIAAFTAASLARAEPIPTAIEAVKFGWTAFIVPFLFIFSPALLMQGDVFIVLGSVVTAVLGVWLASQGIMAYARAHLNTGYRLAYLISGLALLTPFDLFSQAVTVNVGGGVLALILLFKDYRPRPHTASSSK
jgi:TRAP-type uncharacterized transport system fused permease subunit